MPTNNLFQGSPNQIPNNQDSYMNMGKPNVTWGAQIGNAGMNMAFANRPMVNGGSSLPGRVVFSPDQISPQEIPMNGSPALFPLSDGKTIIVKALLPSGMFDEQRFVLEMEPVQNESTEPVESEFDQVMKRIDTLEINFNDALKSLVAQNGNQNNSRKAGNKNEQ